MNKLFPLLAVLVISCKPVVDTAQAQEPPPPRTGGAAVEVGLDDMIGAGKLLQVMPMVNFVALACFHEGKLDYECMQHVTENLDLTNPILSAEQLVKSYREEE